MTTDTTTLPATGTWTIDPSHASIAFSTKHLVVSTVRGSFSSASGTVHVADPVEESNVEVAIDATSISTGDENRDGHLVSGDFLDVENHPNLTFRSTGAAHRSGDEWRIPGELTVLDTTRPVELEVTYLGVVTDPWENTVAGFTASTEIDREAFGMTWNQALEAGGVLVGKNIKVEIDVELTPAA